MITVTISSPDNGPLELTHAVQQAYTYLVLLLGKDNILNERRYINGQIIEEGLCRKIKFDLDTNEIPLGLKTKQGTWKLLFKSPFRKDCKKVEWRIRVTLSSRDIDIPKLEDINKEVFHMTLLTERKDIKKYTVNKAKPPKKTKGRHRKRNNTPRK